MGYAFINFTRPELILDFYGEWMHKRWAQFSSRKRCDLAFGRIQGKAALQLHFANSRTLLSAPMSCRPVLRGDDGAGGDEAPSHYPALADASHQQRSGYASDRILPDNTHFVSSIYNVHALSPSGAPTRDFCGGF